MRREDMSAEELRRFEEQWTKNMRLYWQERLDKLRVNRTYSLHDSIVGVLHPGNPTTIEFKFLQYGVYVDNGTGREISRGNGGDLGFTPKRKPKEWYYRKYYGSRMVLNEAEFAFYGQAYNGMMVQALDSLFGFTRFL